LISFRTINKWIIIDSIDLCHARSPGGGASARPSAGKWLFIWTAAYCGGNDAAAGWQWAHDQQRDGRHRPAGGLDGTPLASCQARSTGKENRMKFRSITPALALAAVFATGIASAQSTAPTTPSTTPNDSTATPPNNRKVPPGTASPAPNATTTPQSNMGGGTATHKNGMHKNGHSTTGTTGSTHSGSTHSGSSRSGNTAQPSESVPQTGAGK
jgi:hypothetical protein